MRIAILTRGHPHFFVGYILSIFQTRFEMPVLACQYLPLPGSWGNNLFCTDQLGLAILGVFGFSFKDG